MARGQGKKVDTIRVKSLAGEEAIDVRLDTEQSMFIAKFGDVTYKNEDLKALRREIEQLAREVLSATFEPMIAYRLYGIQERQWDRADPVVGVAFRALAVSPLIGGKRYKLNASVYEGVFRAHTGEPESYGWDGDREMSERLLPFTPERWQALCEVKAVIDAARDRLLDVFGKKNSPDQVAALLDTIGGAKLLTAGEKASK